MKVHHSARTGEFTANQYVSQDGKQSALYAFLRSQEYLHPVPTVCLRGPDESAIYRVKTTDNKWPHASGTYSGSYRMNLESHSTEPATTTARSSNSTASDNKKRHAATDTTQ